MSVCRVDTAKRITAVVKLSEDLTSITGKIPARALVVFALAVSSIVTDLVSITLFSALVTKSCAFLQTPYQSEYSAKPSTNI